MTATPLLVGPLAGSWRRPEQLEINRLPMRPQLVSGPDAAAARAGGQAGSPWFRSLDDTWDFRLFPRPEAVPDTVVHTASGRGWDPITVPGSWTRQGFDEPTYTNVLMPFAGEAPDIPDDNPTGVYRTCFTRPRGWARRRTVLSIGGAESVAYVWLNGSFVGMGTDSRLASEFDVSNQLAADNHLVVVVVRWAAATWIEDQDHWHHAGLHRSVTLRSTDQVWIEDVAPTTGLSSTEDGQLNIRARIGSLNTLEPGWTVTATVETERGRVLRSSEPLTTEIPTPPVGFDRTTSRAAYSYPGPVAELGATFRPIEPWSHESPTRYRLLAQLCDPAGAVREVTNQWIGFRSVEIRNREVLLNGAPVMIHGVNRHDHDPDTGKTVSTDTMVAELVAMKQSGFNAVRTAHYPNDPQFLDLCDQLGLWVIAEANVESHARHRALCDDPRYAAAMLDRVQRLVIRDRGHACVMGWSLGNEAGYGAVHDAGAAWVRRTDPSRFVQYEGALEVAGGGELPGADGRAATDIVCPMYSPLDDLQRWARTDDERPLILCEYSHAMGNSNGSLSDYWELFENTVGLQGGFIWDWRDQGLRETDDDGREWFAYGGHLGDRERHDANFCINGLVGPDLDAHPALYEHAKLAELVQVDLLSPRTGRSRLRNRQWFRSTDWLLADWMLTVDGEPVNQGSVELPTVAPRQASVFTIPYRLPAVQGDQRIHLLIRFKNRTAVAWAPRGSDLAWSQHEIEVRAAPSPVGAPKAPIVKRDDLEFEVDPQSGAIGIAGLTILPEPTLWRAPIDNDGIDGMDTGVGNVRARWIDWGLDQLAVSSMTATAGAKNKTWSIIRVLGPESGPNVVHQQRLSITDDGWLSVHDRFDIPEEWDDLPRVGIRFRIPDTFDHLDWVGLGPHETYPDRRSGAAFGRWRSTIADQYVPYVRPQEHGLHVETTAFALRDIQGSLIEVASAQGLFAFSASHFSAEAITGSATVNTLEPDGSVHVHIDAAHRGVGTGSCGPDTLIRYRVRGGRHHLRWRLRLVAPD